MRVAIDVSSVVYGTGVSVYTRHLVENLLAIDKENDYTFLGMSLRRQPEISVFLRSLKTKSQKKIYPIPPTLADLLWNWLHMFNIENLVGKVDVFHSSDWTQPPSNAFNVTTIHDLSPIKFPQFTPKSIVDAHKRRFAWVRREVDRVIVPSSAIKTDAIKLGIKPDRIRVIAEANADEFERSSKASIDAVKKKFKVDNYLLAVGTNPRKNTKKIIQAFKELNDDDLKLVVVGQKNPDLGDEADLVYTGYVDQKDIIPLYSGAEALVYPSIDEGFGLPILHAFATKTPVVTSNISAMPETAGGAAVLVNPGSVTDIADGIEKAIKTKDQLIKKGTERVKDFSWEKTARETLVVYKESQG